MTDKLRLGVPTVLAVTPASGTQRLWRWDADLANDLTHFIANELQSSEDLVVLIARPTAVADLVHALREVTARFESGELPSPDESVELTPRARPKRRRAA